MPMKNYFLRTTIGFSLLISLTFLSAKSLAQTTIFGVTSSWKYLDDGSNQGTNWRNSTFSDATWKTGNSELGCGDSPVTIMAAYKIGYYFRKTISISNPTQFSNFTMKVRRDDGIVVYDGSTIFTATLANSLFTNGNNLIAVEVHNRSTSSSDITFEMQLIGNPAQTTSCETPNVNLFGTRNATSSSMEVFWSPIIGASSYNVAYRVRNSGLAYSTAANTNSTYFVLTGLLPVTNYEFIVQSVCTSGSTSLFSPSGWFTTQSGTSPSTSLIRGPYLPVATSSGVTIQWRTSTATNNEVKYGVSTTLLNNTATNSTFGTEHTVVLGGLVANTKYYYSIGPIGSILQGDANNYFYTAPANGSSQAVKFWVTGDFGMGSANQIAVRNSFAAYTAGQAVNGWLWLGDNAYNTGTDAEYQNNVFSIYPEQFKKIPVFPALGNHDYGSTGYQSSAAL